MVCERCEKKLGALIVPDTWKAGSKYGAGGGGGASSAGGKSEAGGGAANRVVSLQILSFLPRNRRCRICKKKVQNQYHYCQACAYE
ncbi:unnamed protein product, partial [Phaeothamnion confervicola]